MTIDPINPSIMDAGISASTTLDITNKPLETSKVNPKATFKDIDKEYQLFSHASLLLASGLPYDPLMQYCVYSNIKEKPLLFKLDYEIFDGHQNFNNGKLFNSLLLALPKDIWKDVLQYLGTITLCDKKSSFYANVVAQKLPMLDYISFTKTQKLEFVDTYVFAIDGNQKCLHYTPAMSPPMDKITFKIDQPNKDVVLQASQLFQQM